MSSALITRSVARTNTDLSPLSSLAPTGRASTPGVVVDDLGQVLGLVQHDVARLGAFGDLGHRPFEVVQPWVGTVELLIDEGDAQRRCRLRR